MAGRERREYRMVIREEREGERRAVLRRLVDELDLRGVVFQESSIEIPHPGVWCG